MSAFSHGRFLIDSVPKLFDDTGQVPDVNNFLLDFISKQTLKGGLVLGVVAFRRGRLDALFPWPKCNVLTKSLRHLTHSGQPSAIEKTCYTWKGKLAVFFVESLVLWFLPAIGSNGEVEQVKISGQGCISFAVSYGLIFESSRLYR